MFLMRIMKEIYLCNYINESVKDAGTINFLLLTEPHDGLSWDK